ncbi:hypothetical protein ACLOJK_023534, partial [Asimina triloba]
LHRKSGAVASSDHPFQREPSETSNGACEYAFGFLRFEPKNHRSSHPARLFPSRPFSSSSKKSQELPSRPTVPIPPILILLIASRNSIFIARTYRRLRPTAPRRVILILLIASRNAMFIASTCRRLILDLLIAHPLSLIDSQERNPHCPNLQARRPPHRPVLRLSLSRLGCIFIASSAHLFLFQFCLENQLKAPSSIQAVTASFPDGFRMNNSLIPSLLTQPAIAAQKMNNSLIPSLSTQPVIAAPLKPFCRRHSLSLVVASLPH